MARFKEKQLVVAPRVRPRYKPDSHLRDGKRNKRFKNLILSCGLSATEAGEFLAFKENSIFRLVHRDSDYVIREPYMTAMEDLLCRILTNSCLKTDPDPARERAKFLSEFILKGAQDDTPEH